VLLLIFFFLQTTFDELSLDDFKLALQIGEMGFETPTLTVVEVGSQVFRRASSSPFDLLVVGGTLTYHRRATLFTSLLEAGSARVVLDAIPAFWTGTKPARTDPVLPSRLSLSGTSSK
jgi:hypothetical protein